MVIYEGFEGYNPTFKCAVQDLTLAKYALNNSRARVDAAFRLCAKERFDKALRIVQRTMHEACKHNYTYKE